MFLKTMLPMILQVNEAIMADREHLAHLMKRSYTQLTMSEKMWVARLAQKYKVSPHNMSGLLHRLDMVPPSLALGQSVVESGWTGNYGAISFIIAIIKSHHHRRNRVYV